MLRVVIVGKTGVGKSSLGNTLLGKNAFQVCPGMNSGTYNNEVDYSHRFGIDLQVTDTPGLFDTDIPQAAIMREVRQSFRMGLRGPHIVLLVLRCDRRFTKEEFSVFTTLKAVFGPRICEHMIVVFNGVDSLGHPPHLYSQALNNELRQCPRGLRQLLNDVGYRYHGVSNEGPWSVRERAALNLIDMMQSVASRNHWSYIM